jgi:hypothetical protein
MNPAERLRAAADTIERTATVDVTPGPWTVTEKHGWDATDEGWSLIKVTAEDGTEVAATAYPGGSEDAVDAQADAAHIALWDPPTARLVADLMRDALPYASTAHPEEYSIYLHASALADAILAGGK